MNVQELFLNINKNRFLDEVINDYKRNSIIEINEEREKKLKTKIEKSLTYFTTLSPKNNETEIIYCIKQKDAEDIIYEVGRIDKNDVTAITPENNLGVSFMCAPWSEVLGIQVSQTSINLYGKTTVAAQIFMEMTYFGFVAEEHEKNKDNFQKKLYQISEQIKIKSEEAKELYKEDDEPYSTKELYDNLELKREFWYKVRLNMKGNGDI